MIINIELLKERFIMKLGKIFLSVILAAIFLWSAAALSAEDAKTAAMVREIEDNLIAPCCWSQPVSQHYSEAAEKIRTEVRQMVASGKTREEILDHFVAQYGERILATPRPKGFNILAYVLPWASLLLGVGFVFVLIKKLRTSAPASNPATPPPPDSSYFSTIEKELKDLEE
jgi:cytochrome c-type biogenesis protein CcmH